MDLYILETSSILAKSIIKPRICIITVIYKMLEGMLKNYFQLCACRCSAFGDWRQRIPLDLDLEVDVGAEFSDKVVSSRPPH